MRTSYGAEEVGESGRAVMRDEIDNTPERRLSCGTGGGGHGHAVDDEHGSTSCAVVCALPVIVIHVSAAMGAWFR